MLQAACTAAIERSDITCDCDLPVEVVQSYIDQASDVLAILSGGVMAGRCCDTVRPRREDGPVCGWWMHPTNGSWCRACSPLDGLTLRGPNPKVTTVMLNGEQFTDYKIVDDRLLVRSDGHGWPGCQNITAASTEPGTFEIRYEYGLEWSRLAKDAVTEIVCGSVTRPPNQKQQHPNARGVSIAGVMITLEQQIDEIKRKTFLMPNVTRFLTVYAPDGPTPAVIYSPELEDGWTLHRVR